MQIDSRGNVGTDQQPNLILSTPTFSIEQFASSRKLPSLPQVAAKLIELAQQEDANFDEVARVIQSDPVMAGKVMTTVNSALFGFQPKIATVRDAVTKLGLNMIRTLLLSFHLARHKTGEPDLEPILQNHWRSSLTQAVFAELLAEEIREDPASCFLAAIVQDIGILAMLSEAPTVYVNNILERNSFPNVAAAERSVFGFSHVEVSVAIVHKWGLPECYEKAIRHHHDKVFPPRKRGSNRLAAVVHAANLGAAVVFSDGSPGSLNVSINQWSQFLKLHFDISAEQAKEMVSEVNLLVNQYSNLFKFNIGESVQTDDVVWQAKTMLQEIALRYQVELATSGRPKRKVRVEDNELYRDSLSGLYNRRFMDEQLQDLIARSIKRKRPMAFLFVDLDNFKLINDEFGHQVGDKAIQHVAEWLNHSIRKNDVAIRLGGDEFVVVLDSLDEDEFEPVATRIAEQIPPLMIGDKEINVGFSVGAIFYQPERGDNPDPNWLIQQADRSMYDAKKKENGQVMFQKYNGQSRNSED